MSIKEKLADLIVQATKERSHYYVRATTVEASNYIYQLEQKLEIARAALKEVADFDDTGTGDYLEDLCREALKKLEDKK